MLKRSVLLLLSVIALSGCADASGDRSLEDSFAADPQLQRESPEPEATREPVSVPEAPELERLPPELPQYEPATWLDTTPLDGDRLRSRWHSDDPPEGIAEFYRGRLSQDNWELNEDSVEGEEIRLEATRSRNGQDWPLTVVIRPRPPEGNGTTDNGATDNGATDPQPEDTPSNGTEIELTYPASPIVSTEATPEESEAVESEPANAEPPSPEGRSPQTTRFSDLDQVSDPLATYVKEVAELGILSPLEGDRFAPEEPMTRRDYARWLLRANNRFHENQSSEQLRQARGTSNPAFQDMPQSHPDFPVIQGLAEAGIIPSPLSGDDTTVLFRPDDPLLREDLLRWKVPLDIRRGLPDGSFEAIQETWGFQDSTRISADALDAVLADFENGERSNIRRAFGYTRLLQPQRPVTRAEAASSLWSFGSQDEARSAPELTDTSP